MVKWLLVWHPILCQVSQVRAVGGNLTSECRFDIDSLQGCQELSKNLGNIQIEIARKT